MNTHRIDPRAGRTRANGSCNECGSSPLPKGRRTFCSDGCVDAWKLRTQPAFAAQLVLKRDGGVCGACGLDCVEMRERLFELHVRAQPWRYHGRHPLETWSAYASRRQDSERVGTAEQMVYLVVWAETAAALQLKGDAAVGLRRLWEMDHIVPVVEGGGSCGLDNLRTLCIPCHRRETADLRKRLSVTRKARGSAKREGAVP